MNEWMNECLESHENESCKARAREENNRNKKNHPFYTILHKRDGQADQQTDMNFYGCAVNTYYRLIMTVAVRNQVYLHS